jgi:carbonic anhydrase
VRAALHHARQARELWNLQNIHFFPGNGPSPLKWTHPRDLPQGVCVQRLIDGYQHFRQFIFPARRDQFHLLAEGQQPEVLFITCADSRVVPDLVLGTGPGDLFITRNAGNVVPVPSQDVDGVTATIEYAVEVLRVRHAILCGHSDCGALKAALDHTSLESLPKARRWPSHVEGAFTHKQPLDPADGEHAELGALIRGNLVAQLLNLRAQPSVARAV